jgi:hypothetical protein
MHTLTMIIILLGLLIITIRFYRFILFANANKKISQRRFDRVKPLYNKLKDGGLITKDDVYVYAKNLMTRATAFELLRLSNLVGIFPGEFNTFEKAAESNLANWLEFPTELNACPDYIQHIKRVTINIDEENYFVHYEVFEFKVNEPHKAAKKGWMLGVVGPYFDDSNPYDYPSCTFSRFNLISNTISADEEAKWVHENILMQR